MTWARGHKNDWDFFASEAGDPAWNYESVLNIYRRIEDIQNLRIADGSIMPRVTTGNTMAPCVIIGEPATEALRNDHRLDRH